MGAEPNRLTSSSATRRCTGCPGTSKLLPRLARAVVPGGWFAFQVPGNFDEPSHTIRRELERLPEFAPHLGYVAKGDAHDAHTYLHALTDLGCTVDAWETTYLHVLHGRDPVFEWVASHQRTSDARCIAGRRPRPVRSRVQERLNEAYPVSRRHRRAAVPARLRRRPRPGLGLVPASGRCPNSAGCRRAALPPRAT